MKSFAVEVKWLNGRFEKSVPPSRYSTMAWFKQNDIDEEIPRWSVVLSAFKRDEERKIDQANARFLVPWAPHDWIRKGVSFKMMEGPKPTAIVTIL
jgi:hypothetical protein